MRKREMKPNSKSHQKSEKKSTLYKGTRYDAPQLSVFKDSDQIKEAVVDEQARATAEKLQALFNRIGVKAWVCKFKKYPQYTRFLIKIEDSIKAKIVIRLPFMFKRELGSSVDINMLDEYMAVDVASKNPQVLRLGDFKGSFSKYPGMEFPLGNDKVGDLEIMQNLLIAGMRGSGVTTCLHSVLVGLLLRNHPNSIYFLLLDSQQNALHIYDKMPYFLMKDVVTDTQEAIDSLDWVIREIDYRLEEFNKVGARNIDEHAEIEKHRFQKIVVIINELGDLMRLHRIEIETRIRKISDESQRTGIHLVIATHELTDQVITRTIKDCIPSRIALKTNTKYESISIIGQKGAEKLLGNGDMLYKPAGADKCERLQGIYISEDEIRKMKAHIYTECKQQ